MRGLWSMHVTYKLSQSPISLTCETMAFMHCYTQTSCLIGGAHLESMRLKKLSASLFMLWRHETRLICCLYIPHSTVRLDPAWWPIFDWSIPCEMCLSAAMISRYFRPCSFYRFMWMWLCGLMLLPLNAVSFADLIALFSWVRVWIDALSALVITVIFRLGPNRSSWWTSERVGYATTWRQPMIWSRISSNCLLTMSHQSSWHRLFIVRLLAADNKYCG